MIVATAGHVDHGKTTLVRALTGVDCDRLPEERRRGLSIEVGFAYAERAGGLRVGFVDVPGHGRFVGNLLAGVAWVDLALLVVAADDGPMPQTREHLTILRLLGVARCVVALTKVDRVDAARCAAARAEAAALLADGPFAGSPVVACDAARGLGVAALWRAVDAAAAARPKRAVDGGFRLAVDRSFVLDGTGRVVTGAVLAGTVRVGDRLVVSPGGAAWRVRGLRAQGGAAEAAVAGDRCALQLAGGATPPARGDWLVAPILHAPTDRLDVRLDPAGGELLAHAAGLQLHLGAAAVPARAVRLGGGFAQLVLARPVAALHGDRFVLRDPAAGVVVGGGRVVDPFAPARGRAAPARLARLAAMAVAAPGDALAALAAHVADGVDLDRFALARNLDPAALVHAAGLRTVPTDAGPRAVAAAHWDALADRLVGALAEAHRAEPASAGADRPALVARLGARGEGVALVLPALAALEADGRCVREGFRWRLPDHRAVLSPADAALLDRVTARLALAGPRPPIVGELASALGLPQDVLVDFLDRATRFGALVRVAPNRWFLPSTVAELAALARRLGAESADGFDAATFRDRSGLGRNLTVQVLECLDREGVTRFDGTRRTVRGEHRPAGTPIAAAGDETEQYPMTHTPLFPDRQPPSASASLDRPRR